ncbi:MAG: hypothetical protein AAGL17_03955 [Cyanobacteria bacterium J06576_12]
MSSTESGTGKLGAACASNELTATGAVSDDAIDLTGIAQARSEATISAEAVLRLTIVQ